MHWMGDGWSHGIFGPIMMLIVLAATVILVLAVARGFANTENGRHGKTRQEQASSPLELLRERSARGEIDAEEFKARRALLDQ